MTSSSTKDSIIDFINSATQYYNIDEFDDAERRINKAINLVYFDKKSLKLDYGLVYQVECTYASIHKNFKKKQNSKLISPFCIDHALNLYTK